jgi:multisubunit Na+/H+ antiporter MnhE subunit
MGFGLHAWFAWWGACMVGWIALTTTLDPAELVVGAVSAAVAATAAELVRATGMIGFRPRLRWFLRAPRVARRSLLDTGVVLMALFMHVSGRRRISGAFRVIDFDPGGNDPTSAARRALTTAAISATPNTYVVGIDRDSNVMLVHQLVPVPKRDAEKDVLGAL